MLQPFFPWVGGKRFAKNEIIKHFPDSKSYDMYMEPFVGAGSLFLKLQPQSAWINDINPWVMMLWHLCASHPEYVIEETLKLIKTSKQNHTIMQQLFEHMLARFNQRKHHLEKNIPKKMETRMKCQCTKELLQAAFDYYVLVKFSYGSKFYHNKDGTLRTYYGFRPFNTLCNENFIQVHHYLRNNDILITFGDYRDMFKQPLSNSLIYIDPPYYTENIDHNTPQYSVNYFCSEETQKELAKIFIQLSKKNLVLQSNSCHPFIKKLYAGFTIKSISTRRALAMQLRQDGKDGHDKKEYLIKNFS